MKINWEAIFTFLPFKQCGGIFKATYEKDYDSGKVTVHAIKRTAKNIKDLDDSFMDPHNLNSSAKGGVYTQGPDY